MSDPLGPWNNPPQNDDGRTEKDAAGKAEEETKDPFADTDETNGTQTEEVPPIQFDFNPYGDPNAVPPVVEPLGEGMPPRPRGMAIASLVLGISSLVLCCFINILPLLAGIVGLVLGIIDLKKNHFSGMALAGVICSGIGVLLGLVSLFLTVTVIFSPEFQEMIEEFTEGY